MSTDQPQSISLTSHDIVSMDRACGLGVEAYLDARVWAPEYR